MKADKDALTPRGFLFLFLPLLAVKLSMGGWEEKEKHVENAGEGNEGSEVYRFPSLLKSLILPTPSLRDGGRETLETVWPSFFSFFCTLLVLNDFLTSVNFYGGYAADKVKIRFLRLHQLTEAIRFSLLNFHNCKCYETFFFRSSTKKVRLRLRGLEWLLKSYRNELDWPREPETRLYGE